MLTIWTYLRYETNVMDNMDIYVPYSAKKTKKKEDDDDDEKVQIEYVVIMVL